MFLNLLLSLMVGIICLMSWMFKRNIELDKSIHELLKRLIGTTELLNHRISQMQIEKLVNSRAKVTKKLPQGTNNKDI